PTSPLPLHDALPIWMGCRLHPGLHVAALGLDLPGLLGIGSTRSHGQARYRTERCQSLAAKAKARHRFQIFQLTNLAGGMTRQSQRQVVGGNAAAIVAHAQQLDTTLLDLNINAPRTRVETVLQ